MIKFSVLNFILCISNQDLLLRNKYNSNPKIALFITHLHDDIEKHSLTISLTIVHIYNPYTGQTLCSKPANLNHERGREKFGIERNFLVLPNI